MQGAVTVLETPERSHAGYRVVIEPNRQRVRAVFRGVTVADSVRVLVMRETRLPPVFYFPRADVRMDLLARTDHHSHCPFKGNASYWTLDVGGETAENAAWSYEQPFDESCMVKDHIAFTWSAMESWFVDEVELSEPPRAETSEAANPFVDWLVKDAWKATSASDLVARLAEGLVAAGFPLLRLRLFIRTLNPQLFAIGYTWQRDVEGVAKFEAPHAGIQSTQYLDSPFAPIINGEGGIRRRLDVPQPRLDYPVLEDLVEEGATDYVAMPLSFSDGQINVVTLVSDRPGGFSTADLGQFHEILAPLGRLLEAHAQRLSSQTLLRTYLGRNAGQRVMDGLVKRGDGENIHAVIWLSDLRGSTGLAERLDRVDYLAALNHYFDCVAGAVIEAGGEVLKFIGDSVLAIFPIDDAADPSPDACSGALDAVRDALARMDAVNLDREARDEPPMAFGVGLHRGDLTYGNVGTERRLDFTVIGSAVNEAARIEALCKTLGEPVLISAAFASGVPGKLLSLGEHELRGVRARQEIFTLPQGCAQG